jgi:hypothetical protein
VRNEKTRMHTNNSKESVVQRICKKNRKRLTVRVKPEDLIVFNQRLKLVGFNSINELVHEFIAERFPQMTEDKQIDDLIGNTYSNGQRTVLETYNHWNFYKKVDLDDMYNYYQNIRRPHPKTYKDLISYSRRFKDQFFTPHKAEELRIFHQEFFFLLE